MATKYQDLYLIKDKFFFLPLQEALQLTRTPEKRYIFHFLGFISSKCITLHSLSFIRNAWKFYTVGVVCTLTSRSLFTFLVFKAFLMAFIKPCTQKWNFPIIVMTNLYFYPFLTLRINIYPREINFLREILVFHWCF